MIEIVFDHCKNLTSSLIFRGWGWGVCSQCIVMDVNSHMISPISPQCILGLFQSFSFYFDSWYQRSTESTPSLKDVDAKEKLREFYAFATNAVSIVNKIIEKSKSFSNQYQDVFCKSLQENNFAII